jgi:hypothetical protein
MSFATTGSESIHAGYGAHQQVVHSPRDSRWYTGLLGASIVVNIVSLMVIFWYMQEKRVDEEYRIEYQANVDKVGLRVENLERADSVPKTLIIKEECKK